MRLRTATIAAAVATVIAASRAPAQQALTAEQQFAKEVYKELLEINSSNMTSGTTVAANAMAKRFRDAGFPEQDIFLGGVRADKHNLVVRYHGKGGPNGPKPLLLLAHIDVVEALQVGLVARPRSVQVHRAGRLLPTARGSSDDKSMAAIFVANLIQLQAGKLRAGPRHHPGAHGRRRRRGLPTASTG